MPTKRIQSFRGNRRGGGGGGGPVTSSFAPQDQEGRVTAQVTDRLAKRLDKTVYVKSDAARKYGDVVAVVDEIPLGESIRWAS